MPDQQVYEITNPKTGHKWEWSGDRAPTEQEITQILAADVPDKAAAVAGPISGVASTPEARFEQLKSFGWTPQRAVEIMQNTPKMSATAPAPPPPKETISADLSQGPQMGAMFAPGSVPEALSSLIGPEKAQSVITAYDYSPIKPVFSALGSALNLTNRPQKAIAATGTAAIKGIPVLPEITEALKGNRPEGTGAALEALGVEPGPVRTLTALAGDIVTDPSIVFAGPILKGVTSLAKAAAPAIQATKEIRGIGPVVNQLQDLFRVYNRATFSPKQLEQMATAGRPATSPEAYRDIRRLAASAEQAGVRSARKNIYDIFKHVKEPERLTTIPKAMEAGAIPAIAEEAPRKAAQSLSDLLARGVAQERAAGVGTPIRQNYVPYVHVGEQADNPFVAAVMNPANRFRLPKRSANWEEAVAAGAEPDIANAATTRLATGARATARAELIQGSMDEFGIPITKIKTRVEGKIKTTTVPPPEGYRKATIPGATKTLDINKKEVKFIPPVIKNLSKQYLPNNIADDLEKMFVVTAPSGPLRKFWEGGMGVWKGYATAVNPSFHVRNAISNTWNMWLGGVRADEMLPEHLRGALWLAGKKREAIGQYSPEVIQAALEKTGTVGLAHSGYGDLPRLIELYQKQSQWEAANPFSQQFAAQQFGRKLGMGVEQTSRIALYLNYLRKHLDDPKVLENAALHVKKYLFDYAELTPFEQKIRSFGYPFFTWLRKDLPLQMESIIKQPGKYSALGHLKLAAERPAKEAGIYTPEKYRPDFIQKPTTIQLPWKTSTGSNAYYAFDLPAGDLDYLSTSHLFDPLATMAQPVAKGIGELLLNRNIMTGSEIYNPRAGGLFQPQPAPEWIADLALRESQVMPKDFPKLADLFGLTIGQKKGAMPQVMAPAILSYLTRQVPWLTKMGKTMYENRPLPQGTLGPLRPDQMNAMGTTIYTQSLNDKIALILRKLQKNIQEAKPHLKAGPFMEQLENLKKKMYNPPDSSK